MFQRLVIVFMFINMIPAGVIGGGPWTQPANRGYSQLSMSGIFSYNKLFSNENSNINLNRDVSDITVQGYFEVGLTDKLTLIGYIPLKVVSTSEKFNSSGDYPITFNADNLSALGNLAIAVKHAIIGGPVLVSGQVRIDSNTSKDKFNTGLRTGYSAWGFTPSIIVGGGQERFYAFVEAGARFRTNDYNNDLIVTSEVGYSPFRKLWLAAVLDIMQTISEKERSLDGSEQTGLYANGQEYIAYGVKLMSEIAPDWGVNLSGFSAFSGNLVAKSMAYTFGIYYEW